jgi:hypothetical protein
MGMPRFMTVLCWATELLGEAAGAGLFSPQAHAAMTARLSTINAAASRVLTYLASQLPYTYVNLVSLAWPRKMEPSVRTFG